MPQRSHDECERGIRISFHSGAVRVSIDLTKGPLANKNNSRNPGTDKDMLQEFIDLNNRFGAICDCGFSTFSS
jgi:hypothetical protein